MAGKLTPKEKMFCIEYCSNGWNGTQAAISAGYSEKTAGVIANENLKKPYIEAEIQRLSKNFEELAAEKGITKMSIVMEHYKIVQSTIAHYHNTWIEKKEFEQLTDEQKACIAEISTQVRKIKDDDAFIDVEYVKIKLYDKQKALDSICQLMGWNKSGLDITGNNITVILQKREGSN